MAPIPELTGTQASIDVMSTGNDQIYDEAAALWREVCSEPPPSTDSATLMDMIMNSLPIPPYDRLNSPHMRAALVSFPKRDPR